MLLATSAAFAAASAPLVAMAAERARGQEPESEAVEPVAIVRVEELPPGESRRFSFPPVARTALCHKGYFNPADGAPTAGPPKRPLTAIALEVRDGTIYAVGRKQI